MYIPENDTILHEVLGAFDFPATLVGAVRYGQGHINDTFCVLCQPQEGDCIRFILQGLSMAAFPRQDELMENFIGVTSHLRKKIIAHGGDPFQPCKRHHYQREFHADIHSDSAGSLHCFWPASAKQWKNTGRRHVPYRSASP